MSLDALLLNVAPELTNINQVTRDAFIGYATEIVQFGVTGSDSQNLAIVYLAAHLLTLTARSGVGGAITNQREGELSMSFEAIGDKGGYEQTVYGRNYLMFRRMFVTGFTTRATAWPPASSNPWCPY